MVVDGIPIRNQNDSGTTTPECCVPKGGYGILEVRDMLYPWNITAGIFVWDGRKCLWEARRLLSETTAGRANQRPERRQDVCWTARKRQRVVDDVLQVAGLFSGSWTLLECPPLDLPSFM